MKSILTISIILLSLSVGAQKKVEWLNLSTLVDRDTIELQPGPHKIILKKTNGKVVTYDTVSVQIMKDTSEFEVNYMPKCKCMNDTTITLGKTITLRATAVDSDGLISKHYWKKVSGSSYGKVSFSNRQVTTFTNPRISQYKFRYEATDSNGGKCSDTVTVWVSAFQLKRIKTK